jgi:hypothetical protein
MALPGKQGCVHATGGALAYAWCDYIEHPSNAINQQTHIRSVRVTVTAQMQSDSLASECVCASTTV